MANLLQTCAATCLCSPIVCGTNYVKGVNVYGTSFVCSAGTLCAVTCLQTPTVKTSCILNEGGTSVMRFASGFAQACTCLSSPIVCATNCVSTVRLCASGTGWSIHNNTGCIYSGGCIRSDNLICSGTCVYAAGCVYSNIMRVNGCLLFDGNYGYGAYGVYNSYKYQHVWSMGTAYKQCADGSGLGNLYGLAYTHTNVGGQSKAGLSHQLLFVQNGVAHSAVGTGMWTCGVSCSTNCFKAPVVCATTRLDVAPDTDVYSRIGKAYIGYEGHADHAAFGHVDHRNTTGWGYLQRYDGHNFFSVPTGANHYFKINNGTEVLKISSTRVDVCQTLCAHTCVQSPIVCATSCVCAPEFIAGNWFRNAGANKGMYHQTNGNYFYSGDTTEWNITGAANCSTAILRFRPQGHEATVRGSVYANSSNQIGFTDANGQWGYQMTTNGSHCWYTNSTAIRMHLNTASALFVCGCVQSPIVCGTTCFRGGVAYLEGNSANWGTGTQGINLGTIHIDPGSATDHYGGAITFGASDTGNGGNAQAGIYTRSDGSYGTCMYLSTTDSYAAGSKTAMSIHADGRVWFPRSTVCANTAIHSPIVCGTSCITIGSLKLTGSRVATTATNLHLDALSAGTTYINYYTGTGGTVFGNGASGVVACITGAGLIKGPIVCATTCLRVDGGNAICLTASNPYIRSGGSHIIVPNGIHVSGGTLYAENTIMARNGIKDDTAAILCLWGGTSGCTLICNKVTSPIVCATTAVRAPDICAYSWFRNTGSCEGLYNEANENHFYSSSSQYWDINSKTSCTSVGLRLRTSGHQGTIRGYLYADTGNSIGFLDAGGSWAYKIVNDSSHYWYSNNTVLRMHLNNSNCLCVCGGVSTPIVCGTTCLSTSTTKSNAYYSRGYMFSNMDNNTSSDRGPWNPTVSSIRGSGRRIHYDEEFHDGNNNISVYNNSSGSTAVTITRVDMSAEGTNCEAPNSSGYALRVCWDGGAASPSRGGTYQNIPSARNKTFAQIFQACLPSGSSLNINENAQGSNSRSYWITNNTGTNKWEWYGRISHAGNSGTFSSGGHISVSGPSSAFKWYIGSMTTYDVTDASSTCEDVIKAACCVCSPIVCATSLVYSGATVSGTCTCGRNCLRSPYLRVDGSSLHCGHTVISSTANSCMPLTLQSAETNTACIGVEFKSNYGGAQTGCFFACHGDTNYGENVGYHFGFITSESSLGVVIPSTNAASGFYTGSGNSYLTNTCVKSPIVCATSYVTTGLISGPGSSCTHGAITITGSKGGYGGIFTCGWTWMADVGSAGVSGIYDSTGSQWGMYVRRSCEARLMYNGSDRLLTTTYGTCTVGVHCSSTCVQSPVLCATTCVKATQLYACPNSAGSVTAHTSGDELVIESSSHNGLSILSPANGRAHIMFGSPTHNLRGWISFDHTTCYMAFHTPAAASGQGQEYLRLTATCLCSANIICAATAVYSPTVCATTKLVWGSCATSFLCTNANYMQLQTQHGYGLIGANNSSWFHFYTDLPGWYFGSKCVYGEICFYAPRMCGTTCIAGPIVCAQGGTGLVCAAGAVCSPIVCATTCLAGKKTILDSSGDYVWCATCTASTYSPRGISTSFVRAAQGWQNYGTVLHVGGRGGSDAGGDFQLYMGHGHAYGKTHLQVRSANNDASPSDSWTTWKTLLDTCNIGCDGAPIVCATTAVCSPVICGTTAVRGTHCGNGAGLTSLNASNLSSGTVATARLPAAALCSYTLASLGGVTCSYVQTQINALVDSAPGALNTLNELAAAMGDDANHATTMTNLIATKLALTGGTLDGGTNTTLNIRADNAGVAKLVIGQSTDGSQGTGVVEVTQDGSHGGGMSYNGDGSPAWASGETADWTTFYALNAGTRTEVFGYSYASTGAVTFNGALTWAGGGSANANTAYGWGNHASAGYITDGNTGWNNSYGFVTSSGNTIIGTDTDISLSGAGVISSLTMTDGVITAHATRNLTLANLGYTGATNANYITNNSQLSNSCGYTTCTGNVVNGQSAISANDFYAVSWFRNCSTGEGMYNQGTGQHWYSDHDDWWNIGGGSTANGIRFRDEHAGTVRGAVYATNGNEVGFLDSGQSWAYRIVNDSSHYWSTNDGAIRMHLNTSACLCVCGGVRAPYICGTTGVYGTHCGNGAGLTSLNASNISSGTIATARLPGVALCAQNFTGPGFTSRNSGNPIAIDSVTTNMVGYVNGSTAAGYSDGAGFSAAYSSSWVGQLFVDFRTGKVSSRGKCSGTWQAHRFMWDNLNLTNLCQLTNGPGYTTCTGTSTLALGSSSSTAHRGDHGVTAYNHSQAAHAPSNANYITNNSQLSNSCGYTTCTGTSTLALGSSSSTAHRGDHGVTAYNHSQAAHAPSNATACTGNVRSDAGWSWTCRQNFNASATANFDTIATASGSQGGIEIYNTGVGNDAFMAFHAGGDYALYFGLDADNNKLSVGGWSMGANKYEIYHSGNKPSLATLGYTGATNANYITNNNQLSNSCGYTTCTGNVVNGQACLAVTCLSSQLKSLRFATGAQTHPDNTDYTIFRGCGAWSGVHPDLVINFHTGIRFGAYMGYQGFRFYCNSTDATAACGTCSAGLLFSVGKGDPHTRVHCGNFYSCNRIDSPIICATGASGYTLSTAGCIYSNSNIVAAAGIYASGVMTWSGGGSANANTAYTHSQAAHAPSNANNYSFPYTVSASEGASTVVQRTSNGYLHASYFNGSGTFSTSGANSGMGRFTGTNGIDTYGRSYSATGARALLNVADGANNYSHPTSAGNKHIPSGGSSGQVLTYSSSGTASWATPSGGGIDGCSVGCNSSNVKMGTNALIDSNSVCDNAVFGTNAGRCITNGASSWQGSGHIAIGFNALCKHGTTYDSARQMAIGTCALAEYDHTTGGNTAIGGYSQQKATTGFYNTSVGLQSLRCGTGGMYNNAAFGIMAAEKATGNENAVFGGTAMPNATSAFYNTVLGACAGHSISTADNVIMIGHRAGTSTGGTTNITTQSNCVIIGNTNINDISLYGDVTVVGSLSKSSGSFIIPHPDPAKTETKDLVHSFVESPTEGDNIYRWQVNVENCKNIIELPDYYKHLNKNDMAWVSPVRHFGNAYGEVTEDQQCVVVCANTNGLYNVLLIGTRKDTLAARNWRGIEPDMSENSPPRNLLTKTKS